MSEDSPLTLDPPSLAVIVPSDWREDVLIAAGATAVSIDRAGDGSIVQIRTDIEISPASYVDAEAQWLVDELARVKSSRKAAIDVEAEGQRLRWITPGAGQAMTYQAKVEEARALAVDGEEANPSHYPMLSAEVGITAASLQDVASIVMTAFQQWQAIGAAIEAVRLSAKRSVDLAEDLAGVAAVSVAWPNP